MNKDILELEVVNKLFLELSQVSTARTRRELELEAERDRLREALRGLLEIAEIHCQLLPDTPAPLDGPIGVARKALEEK